MPSTPSSCRGSPLAQASRDRVQVTRRRRSHSWVIPAVLARPGVELSKWPRSAASTSSSDQLSVKRFKAPSLVLMSAWPENGFLVSFS